ncbi:MAG: NYN domain-containing protein [Deltaproteobacteria bacterium]|nr:NYN domain-containing protein [Deltaproteobacteria bacterium]
MRLIIDGYNLLSEISGGMPTDLEAGRDYLIESLSVYKRVRRVKIIAVFDATRTGRLTGSAGMKTGVDVVFTKAGQEADEVIRDFCRRLGEGATIVTSDAALAAVCKNSGAVVVSSGEFRGLLDAALYEDMKGAAPEDEEDFPHEKKGQAKRPSKAERKKLQRLKKL